MKIEPSEENLPQVRQADVDIATWKGINAGGEVNGFAGTPLDKLFDQLMRKWLIRLVMLRHFLQDFGFPAPIKPNSRQRANADVRRPTNFQASAKEPPQSRTRRLSRGSVKTACGSTNHGIHDPFHGRT